MQVQSAVTGRLSKANRIIINPEDVDEEGIVGTVKTRPNDQAVEACEDFLIHCAPAKTRGILSHAIMVWAGNRVGRDIYAKGKYLAITNGAVIKAALLLDLPVWHIEGTQNCMIGVSRRSLAKLAVDYSGSFSGYKKLLVAIQEQLHQQLKTESIERGVSMREIVTRALKIYLQKKPGGKVPFLT